MGKSEVSEDCGYETLVLGRDVCWSVSAFSDMALHFHNFFGRTKLEKPPIDAKCLQEVFIKYGASPHHCYALVVHAIHMVS